MENEYLPTEAEVSTFEMLSSLIDSIYIEVKELSKKKPDEPINKFKIGKINKVLEGVKKSLTKEPTVEYLDLLEDEAMPSNSDAILIIGQFQACMARFRNEYTNKYHRWKTQENPKAK